MRRFRFIPVLLSLVLLTSLVLSISGAPPVEAGGDIKSEFGLGRGPGPSDVPFLTPVIPAGSVAPSGTGEFEIDGDLDNENLEFELEIDAEGLLPNTDYILSVSLRNSFNGLVPPVHVVDGFATTDDEGRLEFEGEGEFAVGLFTGSTLWRFDQQIRLAGSGGGTLAAVCVDCILVCFPTTLVELVDGQLVPSGG